MLLAIDVGNTNIVIGVFEGELLAASWRLTTHPVRTADEYAALMRTLLEQRGLEINRVAGVSLASTVPPLTSTFRELAARYFRVTPLIVSSQIRTGVRIAVDSPEEVGADRIVDALAAWRLYETPAVVVDFGTATTFDAISAAGELLGTAIAPGFLTSMEGLYAHAAKLQRIEFQSPGTAIGRNTVAAMRSGWIYGYVGLVEGLVTRIKAELGGNPLVIATGGLADLVVRETRIVDVTDGNLTLQGLRLIYDLNHEPVLATPEGVVRSNQDSRSAGGPAEAAQVSTKAPR